MTAYATTFLQSEGMTSDQAFDVNLGSYGMLVFGTILVWFGMGKFGRRPIYLAGQMLMALELGIMGVLGFFTKKEGVSYGVAAVMLVFNLTFACTVGPTCYTIVAEIPASDVRAPSVVAARTMYLISGIVNNQLTPRMVNTNAWGWGARCGLFFLGTNILGTIYCYFRLPETKGRSYAELDKLFAAKLPARKFASTRVDEFEVEGLGLERPVVDQKLGNGESEDEKH
jgi:SP family general alpha glucoside:H+ symporter-like MFS transporter